MELIDSLKKINFDLTGLNKEFYFFDRENLLKNKKLSDRLSSSFLDFENFDEKEFLDESVKYLTRLSYSLFNLITNEKIPNIQFKIESDNAWCDLNNNKVFLGIKMLLNTNLNKQFRLDVLVGILFHEFFHKRFTVQNLNEDFFSNLKIEDFYKQKKEKIFNEYLSSNYDKLIFNFLEDRRIERLGINDLPGYGFFLDETRKYSYILHNNIEFEKRQITKKDILDYILYKILLPELEERFLSVFKTKNNKTETSYHKISPFYVNLEEIFESENDNNKKIFDIILDLKKYIEENEKEVFADDLKTMFKVKNDLLDLIPSEFKTEDKDFASVVQSLPKEIFSSDFNSKIYENVDFHSIESDEMTELKNRIDKLISDTISELEKEENKNESENTKIVEKIPDSEKIGGYDEFLIETPNLDNCTKNSSLLNEAKKSSRDIFKTLGFLDSRYNRVINNYELDEGELDEDELHGIIYGKKELFFEEENLPTYSLDFGILVDESGSMSLNKKINKAKLASLTLALSLHDNKNINLFIYGHTANINDGMKNTDATWKRINLYRYYNTLEKITNINRLYSIKSRSSNADGFAIYKLGEIMSKSKTKNKILVVISDGLPAAINYYGTVGENHTRDKVKELESKGFYVIQICVGEIEKSSKMFSNFIEYSNDKNFLNSFKAILLRKLTEFFNQV